MSLPACPGCGYNSKAGLTTSHFTIYKCSECGHLFCYKCPDSNGARKCPDCGSTHFNSYDKVYLL